MSLEPGIERTEEFTAEGRLERTIGVGTHGRRVVDRSGFGG